MRGGSLVAAGGLGLGLLIHEPAAAIAGFALLGLGLAAVVPIAFAAAGEMDPRATGRLVGRVATVGYVGSVAGPIAIGWLAEATSLRTALGLVVLLALVIAVCGARLPATRGQIGHPPSYASAKKSASSWVGATKTTVPTVVVLPPPLLATSSA